MIAARGTHFFETMVARRAAAALILAAFALTGCHGGGGPQGFPKATVTVMNPVKQMVTDSDDFPGRLQ